LTAISPRSGPALPAPFGVPHRGSFRDQQSNAHASFGRGNLPFLPLARALAIGGVASTVSRGCARSAGFDARAALTRDEKGTRERERPSDEHDGVVTDRQYVARCRGERILLSWRDACSLFVAGAQLVIDSHFRRGSTPLRSRGGYPSRSLDREPKADRAIAQPDPG